MNLLYVTSQTDGEIYVFGIGSEGALTLVQRLSIPGGPAALSFAPDGHMVYVALRNEPGIASLAIDRATGKLTRQDSRSFNTDPCFLSIDRTGQFLLATYFEGAAVSVSAIEENGNVGSDLQWIDTVKGAHCVRLSADNRFAFVPHLSNSALYQYRFDADEGRLEPNNPSRLEFPEGTGTRHLAIHPSCKWAYTSNELASSVSALVYDAERGVYSEMQTLSTLPVGFDGENSCAQIHLSADGSLLLVSNRGHDSLARFAIDLDTGHLEPQGYTPTDPWPRTFAISADGRFVYVAGRDACRVCCYRLEANSNQTLEESYPVGMCTMWIEPRLIN